MNDIRSDIMILSKSVENLTDSCINLHAEIKELKKQNENLEHRIKQLEREADSDSHY